MRRWNLLVLSVACVLAVSSALLAGNGRGPGDGTGTGPCICGAALDADPVDGLCDICGGCIPDDDRIGPCDCGEAIDVDPVDGLCDACGGCVPKGKGRKGRSR